MSETEATKEEAGRGVVGDLETAGETTAADTIKGPDDERAVGEGTEVEVEEEQNRER
jgi:hypothetical protein